MNLWLKLLLIGFLLWDQNNFASGQDSGITNKTGTTLPTPQSNLNTTNLSNDNSSRTADTQNETQSEGDHSDLQAPIPTVSLETPKLADNSTAVFDTLTPPVRNTMNSSSGLTPISSGTTNSQTHAPNSTIVSRAEIKPTVTSSAVLTPFTANSTTSQYPATGVSNSTGMQAPTLTPNMDLTSAFTGTTGPSSSDFHQPTSPTTAVSPSTQGGSESRVDCSAISIKKPSYKTPNEILTLENSDEIKNSTLTCNYTMPSISGNSFTNFTLCNYTFNVLQCTKLQIMCTFQECRNEFPVKLNVPPSKGSYNANFTVEKDSITFVWSNFNGSNCSVQVNTTCTHGNETFKNRGEPEVKELKPYTNYSCTSQLLYDGDIIVEQSENIRTKIGTPGKVASLQSNVINTTIEITWGMPQTRNGPLTGFILYLDNRDPVNIPNTYTNSYKFESLDPFTTYIVNVRAYNTENNVELEGDPVSKAIRTEEGIPTQVMIVHVFVGPDHNNAITIHCKEPSRINGEKGQYKLILNNEIKKNSDHCKFYIKDLSYLTSYNYEIFYQNNRYSGIKTTGHIRTKYNDKALIGFLAFLISITTLALLIVLFKIYKLKKKSSSNHEDNVSLIVRDDENQLLNIEPILVEQLLETYKRKNADEGRLFLDEFQSIPRVFSKFAIKEARMPCNQPKNRYIDILPYDDNRVVLSEIHGEPGSNYINASYINGFKEPRKYIAAQGPKEETMNDFWRMIWEQKSTIIVMVTRCEEGNRNKCVQYWPSMEAETEQFGDIVVKITEEKFFPDYITRKLHITSKREKSGRDITHIQFTVWPDHGVPDDPNLLLKLRRRVNALSNFFSGPIIVHCSAGVGRTGTYISIDAMLEGLEAEGRVDVYGYVVQLRRQRCLMVQVESQYIFIHKSLVEYNQYGETEVSLPELPLLLNNLKKMDPPSEPSQLKCEFQRLPSYKNWRPQTTGNHQDNKDKNRNLSIVPYEFNRVHIKADNNEPETEHVEDSELSTDEDSDSEDSSYINASYIIGYWGTQGLIAAQSPLTNTVCEFWQMIFQRKIKAIVMLSSPIQENNEDACAPYWKEKNKTYDDLEIELTNEKSCGSYIERCFEIRRSKRKDVRKVSQFHYGHWEGDLPKETKELLEMIEKIRKHFPSRATEEHSRHDKSAHLLVHCSDGSQLTGTFCALWNIIESAHVEGVIDVSQTVKNLRRQRLGMVSSFEQYEFLYDTIASTVPAQNGQVKSSIHQEDKLEIENELENKVREVKDSASSGEDTSPKPKEDETISNGPSPDVTLRIDE